MEKKIRVTLPKKVANLLENDSKEYFIKMGKLLNYIYENFYKKTISRENQKLKSDTKILQFTLNKRNKENYYNFLEENGIQNEAKFFRELFIDYSLKVKKEREYFLYDEIIKKIEIAINKKKIIKIIFFDDNTVEVEPYFIGSSNLELGNYLFSYNILEKKWKNYKIKYIKNIFLKNCNFETRNQNYINEIKENYDPFLSFGKEIKIKLSSEGEKIFKSLEINRPRIIKKDKNIYILEASEEKAKRYFSYFLNEVEILEPLELRKWFKERFILSLKNYQDD